MANNCVRCISRNINGFGDPEKRGKVLMYLKHNKADIAFIQETHFRGEDAAKLKSGWVGPIFIALTLSKRNRVCILININLSFVLVRELKDKEGRMVCIEAVINGKRWCCLTYMK